MPSPWLRAMPAALFLALTMRLPSLAAAPLRFHGMSEAAIAGALSRIHREQPDLAGRVAAVSAGFLTTPYKLGPLGEGNKAEFDRDPLYSFQQADCTTFVEQVMALSLERNLQKALKTTLQKIRYKDGAVGYETRNHFPETDWLPNNIRAGFIEDITERVGGGKAKVAVKLVSKADWYAGKTKDDIQGFPGLSPEELEAKLAVLRSRGEGLPDEEARIPFIPVEALPAVLAAIPSGTIANIVREPRADKPVLITHQTLVVEVGGRKVLRHAAYGRQVEDVPVMGYFSRLAASQWRVVGVNLLAIH
ncbi:MAG: DUF1460 domain-containing protein [Elusimicrobia bacterium]|nr:DUF1460 domain-containing protein [Elusimicrobiota bacterium]